MHQHLPSDGHLVVYCLGLSVQLLEDICPADCKFQLAGNYIFKKYSFQKYNITK